jgi:hypothetical protein
MALLDLSVEILQQIIKDTIPEGFEPLALSCKRLYAASQLYLKKYNKWNRYACQKDGQYVSTPRKLLLEIARDPDITRYIQHADFRCDPHNPNFVQLEASILVEAERCRDRLETLLDRSTCFQDEQQDSNKWLQQLLAGHCGFHSIIVMVLSQLPNLKELQLPRMWVQKSWLPRNLETELDKMIEAMIRAANDPTNPLAGLSTLTALNPVEGTGHPLRRDISVFSPFLGLHSLRTLYCGSILIYPSTQKPPPMTFLTTIEMAGCCIDSDGMALLLKSTPRLRILRFSYEEKFANAECGWDAGSFVKAIEREVGETLEELSLSIWEVFGSVINPVTCMKGFTQLKTLELDMRLLLGVERESASLSLQQRIRIPLEIQDILPPSIATFRLLMNDSTEHLDCLAGLATSFYSEIKSKRSNLTHIEIRCAVLSKKDHILGIRGVCDSPVETSRRLKQLADSFNSFSVYFKEEHVSVHKGFPCADFMTGFLERLGDNSFMVDALANSSGSYR